MKNKLTNKMLLEIIVIPLCVMYLYNMIFHSHSKANLIVFSLISIITGIELLIKYIHEVYVYESKRNIFKVIMIIFGFSLIITIVLNLFLKYQIINILFIVFEILLLIYLLYFTISNLVKMKKNKGAFHKNAIASFFSFLSFSIILIGLIINLK